ncbi:trypsin-like serine protease with C-terminal PDZ domain [Sphaerochaeta pleomorpha str. Grapes]|uniref:Trypsin-like serine protease with C-terminal PDZ domain n=1 Tax=Sphaerochaeta pleomorpha (strain ATCC BAA-1885 / DSM 22778 / Grapes) TaxID=158190 RepID=G8QYE8_SPHPG|nr:trypsin-like peptidase domain-containing protein [Sphaerochaeta pleomorpha]AEV30795.1 trypsin-like serine protease with C-terminal PDZ domain [Sphaerochaeta pleomorpha str. Grapes]
MLKDSRKRFIQVLVVLTAFVLVCIASLLLWRWTNAIQVSANRKELEKVLHTIVKDEGEVGLLSMAGVSVDSIFYGDEGITLFEGQPTSWRYTADERQSINVYESTNKSVVHITSTVDVQVTSFMDVLPAQGTGSGIILSSEGYILTNAHVVEKAASLKVSLYDQSSYTAKLIGVDSEDDLAVIKISVDKDTDLIPITLGTSEDLRIGQKVIAIGNPFGYDRTMTVGVVSGLNRPVKTAEGKVIMDAIQTDASINPGNSGGPLLNSRGEVIGINSSIYSMNGSSQGINFAIPIDTAISIIPDLIKLGRVSRGWLDIVPVQLTPQLSSYAKLSVDTGILVSQVVSGGLAEKAGLKGGSQMVQYGSSVIYLGGDVIRAIDGKQVNDLNDLYLALLDTHSGDTVKVLVNRKGEQKTLVVQLVERSAQNVSALVR